jgi:hypothetical protein
MSASDRPELQDIRMHSLYGKKIGEMETWIYKMNEMLKAYR